MLNLESYATPRDMPSAEPGRLVSLLTLDERAVVDEVALAREVGEGLPTRAAMALIELLGRRRVVGPILPEANLRRYVKNRKPLPREHSERLFAVGRVVDAAAHAWHSESPRGPRHHPGSRDPRLVGRAPLRLRGSPTILVAIEASGRYDATWIR